MLRAADGDKYVNFLINDEDGPSAGSQAVGRKKNIPISTSAGLSKSPSFPAFCAAFPAVPTADGCSFFLFEPQFYDVKSNNNAQSRRTKTLNKHYYYRYITKQQHRMSQFALSTSSSVITITTKQTKNANKRVIANRQTTATRASAGLSSFAKISASKKTLNMAAQRQSVLLPQQQQRSRAKLQVYVFRFVRYRVLDVHKDRSCFSSPSARGVLIASLDQKREKKKKKKKKKKGRKAPFSLSKITFLKENTRRFCGFAFKTETKTNNAHARARKMKR